MAVPLLAGAFSLAIVVPLIVKVLLALGIGFVSYQGADFVVTAAQSAITSELGALPSDMFNILAMAGVDEGIKILFAGASASITIRVTFGAFTKLKVTPPVPVP